MNLYWFLSSTARHAGHMARHVEKYARAQRDILSAEALERIAASVEEVRQAIRARMPKAALQERMAALESAANKWLKPYPNAAWRENVEVLLIAIAVAMGIRTFFLQPFKIPTGSMQPTLFGITSNPDFTRQPPADSLMPNPDFTIPNPIVRFAQFWFNGIQYKEIIARADGSLQSWDPNPQRLLLFNIRQRIQVGGETYTIWFPPDNILRRAGLTDGYNPVPKVFKKGETIMKIKVVAGDHLFVDRMTYNFRKPRRGEIIVFETKGIEAPSMPQDQYYIKRMVAMGGDKVRIGNDRHLIIDGKRLDAATPHFEFVYSFDPNKPPMDSEFSGHVNETVAQQHRYFNLAPKFPDENTVYEVPKNRYIVMGDNTVNSYDSRGWGDFARENVIGRSFFVYWPIGDQNGRGSRFGWATIFH